jgi:Kef-type K+ transport system membrane component KefB/nucleotide-binding universal stress UspA family protein
LKIWTAKPEIPLRYVTRLTPAMLFLMSAGPALAAGDAGSKPSEAIFISQIIVLLVVGRCLGEVMLRMGQPAVMGQLLAGVLLGPSALGALAPDLQTWLFPTGVEQKSMLEAISAIGVLLLLLLTGMETDLALVRGQTRSAFSVSVAGIALPFACGVALGEMLPVSMLGDPTQRLVTSLFLGTALSISSVKIVAMVVRDMGFSRRKLGQIIMAAAIIDDTLGWLIISMTFSIALHGGLDFAALTKSVVGTAAFIGLSFTLGRRLVFHAIRWTNDTFHSEVPVITAIIVIMCVMALITDMIGVHTVLGAFMAGILIGQSPILTRHIEGELRGLITALFMPVFFGMAGLSADFSILKSPWLVALSLLLIAIASVGKFSGAFVGGWFGGMTGRESLALGCAMNARGSTEVIVATIGLSMGALSQDLYTMIVIMAVTTTLAMPPMLRAALRRLPMTEEERVRLETEEAERDAFLPNLERLLVVTDQSEQARFASRLAALLAVPRGIPVTLMQGDTIGPDKPQTKKTPTPNADALEETAALKEAESNETRDVKSELLLLVKKPGETPVSEEVKKGYGLTLVGFDDAIQPKTGLDPRVLEVARDVPPPLAISIARGVHALDPLDSPLNILVPVNGTDASRRGAEVAFALAAAEQASVLILHVATSDDRQGKGRDSNRRQRHAVLRDMRALAERMKVPVRTVVRHNRSAPDAIARQGRLGGHNLVVMGLTRRTGDELTLSPAGESVVMDESRSALVIVF